MKTAQPTREQAKKIQLKARSNPRWFFNKYLGIDPWRKQIDVAESIRDHRITTVRSCHGSGKSFIAARIALWFLLSHPNAVVITTAPTLRQVKEVLWRELHQAFNQSLFPYPGKLNTTSLSISDKWYALGITGKDADAVNGFHADHFLVIVDEAAGVTEPMFEAIDSLASSANSRVCYIGNPTSSGGTFYDSHRLHIYDKIHISAFDTPNFTANGIKRCTVEACIRPHHPAEAVVEAVESGRQLVIANPHLVSVEWVYERIFKWGIGSPMWDSRVEGEFPKAGEHTLIPLNKIELAREQERWDNVAAGLPRDGVDVARAGTDQSAILHRLGHRVQSLKTFHTPDTTVLNDDIEQLDPENPDQVIFIDVIGVGGPVYDNAVLRKNKNERAFHRIIPVNVSQSPTVKDPLPGETQFFNLRSELWWKVRQLFVNDLIALPYWKDSEIEELVVELASIEYSIVGGKVKVEEKEQTKKRIGRSPDRGDALMLSYAVEVAKHEPIKHVEDDGHSRPYTSGLINKQF